jgi:hypothetical protein
VRLSTAKEVIKNVPVLGFGRIRSTVIALGKCQPREEASRDILLAGDECNVFESWHFARLMGNEMISNIQDSMLGAPRRSQKRVPGGKEISEYWFPCRSFPPGDLIDRE